MTTPFTKRVKRVTEHATIRSKVNRKIVVTLGPDDIINLRLAGERRSIDIAVTTIYYHALALDAAWKNAEVTLTIEGL